MHHISIQCLKRRQKSLENLILAKGNAPVEVCQVWQNSNLIWIMLWQIHIPNFKSIYQKTTEKSPENWSVTDRLTDGQTDSEQINSLPGKLVGD